MNRKTIHVDHRTSSLAHCAPGRHLISIPRRLSHYQAQATLQQTRLAEGILFFFGGALPQAAPCWLEGASNDEISGAIDRKWVVPGGAIYCSCKRESGCRKESRVAGTLGTAVSRKRSRKNRDCFPDSEGYHWYHSTGRQVDVSRVIGAESGAGGECL